MYHGETRSGVHFEDLNKSLRTVPPFCRSINVDLEPGTLDHIKSGPLGKLFHPSNFIAGEVRP